MFDSRIFYLQMTNNRHRPQLVPTDKRRDPRATSTRTPGRSLGH